MGDLQTSETIKPNKIKWFYIYRIFTLNHFFTAIYVVYLRSLGFSFLTIASLHLAKDISSAVLELPLSYLSDRIGHKKVMVLPGIATILMLTIITLKPTTVMLHLAFVLWGVAVAADSGVSDAYLYSAVGWEKFPVVQSNTYSARQVFAAFFKLIGSIAYGISNLLPFLLSGVNSLVSSFSSLFLVNEHSVFKKKKGFFSFSAIRQTLKSREFLTIISHNTILVALLGISFTYESVLLVDRGLQVELLGVVGLVKALSNSIGSAISKKFTLTKKINLLYFGFYWATSLGIFLLAIARSYSLSLFALVLISIINGIMMPYKTVLLNHVIVEDRATLLSVQAQLSLILRSSGALLIGWIADNRSTEQALFVLALALFVSIIVINVLSKGQINELVNENENLTT